MSNFKRRYGTRSFNVLKADSRQLSIRIPLDLYDWIDNKEELRSIIVKQILRKEWLKEKKDEIIKEERR